MLMPPACCYSERTCAKLLKALVRTKIERVKKKLDLLAEPPREDKRIFMMISESEDPKGLLV